MKVVVRVGNQWYYTENACASGEGDFISISHSEPNKKIKGTFHSGRGRKWGRADGWYSSHQKEYSNLKDKELIHKVIKELQDKGVISWKCED